MTELSTRTPFAATLPTPAASRATRRVLGLLKRLPHGRLDLHLSGTTHRFGPGTGPAQQMQVLDTTLFQRVLRSGDIGLAEAWMDGHWHTPDLPGLLALLMHNRDTLESAVYGHFWGALVHRVLHALRRNSRAGSRRNIEAHYDLGNAFYTLWLDATMNYSSAWFNGQPALPLPQAQHQKVARALDEAGVGPGARLLEIGCGWGAVAEAAARRGAQVTGITLSHEQLAWARERLAGQGLAADLRLQDYRDLAPEVHAGAPRYDAVVSIEMIEAVGRAYWPGYFSTLREVLAPGGRACVQSIVIRDDRFERYARGTDFIQRYVFPGGMLPSRQVLHEQAARAGLRVVGELDFGPDYAHTLRHWRRAFLAQLPQVRAQGFDERFVRLWDFYLAYCEAAFDTGQTSVLQVTLAHA